MISGRISLTIAAEASLRNTQEFSPSSATPILILNETTLSSFDAGLHCVNVSRTDSTMNSFNVIFFICTIFSIHKYTNLNLLSHSRQPVFLYLDNLSYLCFCRAVRQNLTAIDPRNASAVDIRFDANRTYNFNLIIGESINNNGLSTESFNKSTSPW